VQKAGLEPEVLAAAICAQCLPVWSHRSQDAQDNAGDDEPHFSLRTCSRAVSKLGSTWPALDIEIPATDRMTAGVRYARSIKDGAHSTTRRFQEYADAEPEKEELSCASPRFR